jgi:hypothetical protein
MSCSKKMAMVISLAICVLTSSAFAYESASDSSNPFLIDTTNQGNMAAIARIGAYASKTSKVGGNGIEFAFRYKPIPFIATEAGIGYYNAGPDAFFEGDDKMQAVPLTASLKGVLPFFFGNLYGGGGVGEYFSFVRGAGGGTRSNVGFHYGGGIELYIQRGEMILFDYKHMQIDKKTAGYDFSGDMFSLGFGFRF